MSTSEKKVQAVPAKKEAPAENRDNAALRAEKTEARNRRVHHRMLLRILAGMSAVIFFCNLALPDRDYSPSENRALAQRPKATSAALAEGSFFSDYTAYYADQFLLRDRWMSLSFKSNYLRGVREFDGVLIGKDGYLLSRPANPDEAALQNTIQAINAFSKQHADMNTCVMLVPGSAAILEDKLPEKATVRDQNEDISAITQKLSSSIHSISLTDTLKMSAQEDLYYRTDHHWTSLGAYLAFQKAAGTLGLDTAAITYQPYLVSDTFQGTLSSKSGDHSRKDPIHVYRPQGSDVSYIVYYPDLQKRSPSMFESAQLEEKDQYTVFFGGNHPLVEIQTTADTRRSLLIFKDSYANSFVQFLTPYFDSIVLVDPRYYYDDISAALKTYAVTDILYLYSADTFVTDTALADTLNAAL